MKKLNIISSEKAGSGFKKNAFISDDLEILMNNIKKGTEFKEHKHSFAQFGFCFKGSFMFEVENEKYEIKEGDTYNLLSDVSHKAEFLEDIVALDFKYYGEQTQEKIIDVNLLKEEAAGVRKCSMDNFDIFVLDDKYSNNILYDKTKIKYILPYGDIRITINSESISADSEKVYRSEFSKDDNVIFEINKLGKVLLVLSK